MTGFCHFRLAVAREHKQPLGAGVGESGVVGVRYRGAQIAVGDGRRGGPVVGADHGAAAPHGGRHIGGVSCGDAASSVAFGVADGGWGRARNAAALVRFSVSSINGGRGAVRGAGAVICVCRGHAARFLRHSR